MDKKDNNQEQILNLLAEKSTVKFKVHDNTVLIFDTLKKILNLISKEYNSSLKNADQRTGLEFKDNGKYEAQLKVAGDLLVFSMHTNVFEFNREHNMWKTSLAIENPLNTYCGIINIYNFLNDSFKHNRLEDLGYLIARIFINKDLFFLVEGKRQLGFIYNNFGQQTMDNEILTHIITTSIIYSLEFDLLVPPYDTVKIASVAQMAANIENSRVQTAKRLGFKFNSDDVCAQ